MAEYGYGNSNGGLMSDSEDFSMKQDKATEAGNDPNQVGPSSLSGGGDFGSPIDDPESGGPFKGADVDLSKGKDVPSDGQFLTDVDM